MVTRRSIGNYGSALSVDDTTSTGPGAATSVVPSDQVAISTLRTSTAAVATAVQAQGSLDGANWFPLGAAQSYQTTGVTVYLTTGAYLVTHVRANVNAHSATGPISVNIVAR